MTNIDEFHRIQVWARSSAWLERSTDNRKVMCSNHIGPIFNYLILSDIAPNTTGHQSTDHLRIATMLFDIIELLEKVLVTDGSFITKIWKGSEEKEIINQLKKKFKFVSYFKPDSSRKDSAEIFIVARNFIS